jgi:hypothetical protein
MLQAPLPFLCVTSPPSPVCVARLSGLRIIVHTVLLSCCSLQV